MQVRAPAHVIFIRRGGQYRAVPPAHAAPPTDATVCFRNLTGSPVRVWFPGDFLRGSPTEIAHDATQCFEINAAAGAYTYAAQVTATNEFVEGNSPPEIIIDR